MTPHDQDVARVVAAQARGRERNSQLTRLIKANGQVAVLDRAIIAHERGTAPMIRLLQQLMRSDAIDRDLQVPADDGGAVLTFDDFENAVLSIAMSLSALTVARRAAVELDERAER